MSSDEQTNADQIAYWNDRAGETWTAFQERLDTLFAPLTATAVDAAAVTPGENIVDIGCGCGATVLALAQRTGPQGHVLGLDVSTPMSGRARQRIAAAGLTNAAVTVSDAATHSFASADADLLFSRFGVMFFANPIAAFSNLRRAMRPGGRLLCAVWRPLAENPWFNVPLDAGRPLLPPQQAADPFAPGPFAFADKDRTLGILASAGWRDGAMRAHDAPMKFAGPGELEQATDFATRVGALARMLADADAEARIAVRAAVAKALQRYDSADGITLMGAIWLISARA